MGPDFWAGCFKGSLETRKQKKVDPDCSGSTFRVGLGLGRDFFGRGRCWGFVLLRFPGEGRGPFFLLFDGAAMVLSDVQVLPGLLESCGILFVCDLCGGGGEDKQQVLVAEKRLEHFPRPLFGDGFRRADVIQDGFQVFRGIFAAFLQLMDGLGDGFVRDVATDRRGNGAGQFKALCRVQVIVLFIHEFCLDVSAEGHRARKRMVVNLGFRDALPVCGQRGIAGDFPRAFQVVETFLSGAQNLARCRESGFVAFCGVLGFLFNFRGSFRQAVEFVGRHGDENGVGEQL